MSLPDTLSVAKSLLGATLIHYSAQGITSGKIVETEAYLHKDDLASHSARGQTSRNLHMFGPAGTAYIYRIYGNHLCVNVVTNQQGIGEAVLIRALEPVEGIELMRQRRGVENITELCSGPAKLTQAMAITMDLNGHNLAKKPLILIPNLGTSEQIVVATRVGISKSADLPYRFYVANTPYISRK